MDTLEFLRLVWPAQGQYLLAIPNNWINKQTGEPAKGFKHFSYQTIEAAAAGAIQLSTDRDRPCNVFFALGTVTGTTEATIVQTNGKPKIRGGENIAEIKCFWFDLDVKADPQAYATQAEAGEGIRAFCKAMGLPRPYITSSGGGLHIYWPLDTPLPAAKWLHYAKLLKALGKGWGLRADPARTSDRASVLRPVGTFNWKTGDARPVRLVMEGVVSNTDQFLQRISYLAETANIAAPVAAQRSVMNIAGAPPMAAIPGQLAAGAIGAAGINAAAAAGAGYDAANPKKVVGGCLQLKWQAANPDQVSEPQWYDMVGCLRHAERGEDAVHAMSRIAASYDQSLTTQKIEQHKANGIGPTLCETFDSHNPGGCIGCPFLGKIKTPLQIVRSMTSAAPPTVQASTVNGLVEVQLPDPPAPYKRVKNVLTGEARIALTLGDSEEGEVDVVIYEYDIYPSKLIFDEREQRYCIVVNRWLPHDGWKEFEIPAGRLYNKRELATTFGDIGVWPDISQVEHLVQYMVAYIRDLQKMARSSMIYAQLGWRAEMDRFVLPHMVVTDAGCEAITPSLNITNALSWQAPRGDLDTWKRIVSVYEKPGLEALQFGFGVGFAAPLFVFTNFAGMIVSLVGDKGCGKSTAAMCANSIWGSPKMGWADMEHDTLRAFYNKLGVLHSLPVTYDEITNLDPEMVSDLCYAVSKGQGRQRLNQDGSAKENFGNWQTIMLTTSNRGLHGKLAMAKSDASAESVRVFEYQVPSGTLSKQEADDNFLQLIDHFGLAGEQYARQLMVSQAWAKGRVREWIQQVDTAAKVTSGERFWSAGVACVLAGFELANQCGLTNVDVNRLFNFAVKAIFQMRGTVESGTRSPVDTLADYLNTKLRSMLVLATDGKGSTLPLMPLTPSDGLRIRMERYSGNLYLDRADLRRFCLSNGTDFSALERDLRNLGVLKDSQVRMTLGKGTQWSTAQTHCWKLDLNHNLMSGVANLSVVSDLPATVVATP